MPEGDTIFKVAARLRPVMEGRIIEHAWLREPGFDVSLMEGQTVTRVEARGKHLLVHLGSRTSFHSHLGLDGSWHLYRRGQPWRRREASAAMVISINGYDAACFDPTILELLTADELRRHAHLRRLGPDLLSPEFDPQDALIRFRVHDRTPLGEAVMNQTIVAGIGNVYKSDVLFLLGFDPFAPVAKYTDDELLSLLAKSRGLLKRNVGSGPRQTRFRGDGRRLWAYGRSGEPCFKCGCTLKLRRQGDAGRTTVWCPECQPARS